jgi:hypothetical protein
MFRRASITLLGLAVGTAALSSAQNYAQRSVNIRAGVVVIESQQLAGGTPANFAPFAWFNLDSNQLAKPAGWNFYNPSAATRVTPQIAARWLAHNTNNGYGAVGPAAGENLTKRDAAYWEFILSQAPDTQITDYDILLLAARRNVALNPLEREKLRKFMEGGGVLWVDVANAGGTLAIDLINQFPLPFTVSNINLGGSATGDFNHPLLSVPNTLGFDSLSLMQSEALLGLRTVSLAAFTDLRRQQSPQEGDGTKLLPVASDNLGPTIAVGQVGDGFLVVTTRGVATTLNRVQGQPNQSHRALNPIFDKSSDAAGKLASNMAFLTAGHAQNFKGARKVNSTPIDIGAPLLKRFDATAGPYGPLNLNSGQFNYVPPVIFQGMAVVSAPDGRIYVYDANPGKDLNADGNPDDGISDLSRGAYEDLIWVSVPMAAPISPAACMEIPDATGAPQQQISVTDATGTLHIFNAFPGAPGPNVPQSNSVAPPGGTSPADTTLPGRGPYAPTYHDGLLFMTDEASAGLGGIVGRVWVVDARIGTHVNGPWQAGGSSSPSIQRPSSSAVVGYIPIADNSGGVDRVLYVPTRPNGLGGVNAGFVSLWLGAKGEKPSSFSIGAGSLIVNTRAAGQGLSIFNPIPPGSPAPAHPLGIKLTVLDAVGNPLDATAMDGLFTGAVTESNGTISFGLEGTANTALIQGVRVDYTIDWGTGDPLKTSQLVRGQLFLPDDTILRSRRILHNLALSPGGTLHLVHGSQPSPTDFIAGRQGGAFYSFREDGRGIFKMVNRYELYPQHTVTLNQASPVSLPPTLSDSDGLQSLVPMFLGGPLLNLSFEGGPAIHNGVVYVTARGTKTFGIPCTILMAFPEEPDLPKFEVGNVTGGFSVVQPDFARSDNKSVPNQYSTLQGQQFIYEREPGTDRGTIRIDNLMTSGRGQVLQSISRSQPIILRRGSQPDVVVEPNRSSRWNPMLWYIVFHGYSNMSPPVVTGKTVFLAGNSALPGFIQSNWTFPPPVLPPPVTGMLIGMEADISPTDKFLFPDTARPWLKQLWQLNVPGPGIVEGNPDVLWPQNAGVTSFEAWGVRVLQTTLGNSANAFGVVAGDGALFSWSELGLWGFSRSDFVVTDEGRLGKFDPAGNPVWTADTSLLTGPATDTGSAAAVKPLVRATRAYPVGTSDLMVVDTGADRVMRLDKSGRELRSIEKIVVDDANLPEGFNTNAPLTFKAPRDVLTYTSYQTSIPFSNPSPTGLEYWVHYVVADSGNKRIVELVDRYRANATTRRLEGAIPGGLGVLLWHSPSSFSGKNFSYTSIARLYVEDIANPANSRWVYAAGIGSSLPTRVDTGLDSPNPARPRESEGGNGGIVIFDGSNSQVINEVTLPATAANVFFNPSTGAFDLPARPVRQKLLGNLTSVSMRNKIIGGNTFVTIMFTDAEGVFEIAQNGVNGPWQVVWMLPNEAYKAMRRTNADVLLSTSPRDVRAYYARRLDSGEVLIVNGYIGTTIGNQTFNGEVIQVDGDTDLSGIAAYGYHPNKKNLGFRTFSIRFELPPIQGARGLVIPVFADRR